MIKEPLTFLMTNNILTNIYFITKLNNYERL